MWHVLGMHCPECYDPPIDMEPRVGYFRAGQFEDIGHAHAYADGFNFNRDLALVYDAHEFTVVGRYFVVHESELHFFFPPEEIRP